MQVNIEAEERLELSQKTLGLNHHNLDEAAVRQIASKYRLTGGAIVNVLRYAAVHALKRGHGPDRRGGFDQRDIQGTGQGG